MLMTSLILVPLLLSAAAALQDVDGIPSRPLGFVFNNGSPSAPVQWEAFVDINCPDCRTAFPIILQVAGHYGPSKIALKIYNYPLPWHTNAFMGVQGAFAINNITRGVHTFDWYRAVYTNLDIFDVSNTANYTANQVLNLYANLSSKIGVSSSDFVAAVIQGPTHDQGELDWAFSAARGVAGTPTFFINGVLSDADETWTFDQWTSFFDRLLDV